MNLTKTTPVVLPTMVSPLGKACSRMDLSAVHEILLKTGYKDEECAENEVRRSAFITLMQHISLCKKIKWNLYWSVVLILEALIPRVDTTSSRHGKHEEIRRCCVQGQGFQECYRLLFQGTIHGLITLAFDYLKLFHFLVESWICSWWPWCRCHLGRCLCDEPSPIWC